jgi:D-alanine--poly(phosphoribitol) ligase subunit 2
MTGSAQLVEELGALFADNFHVSVPAPTADLLEEGILDSFQFVELLVQIEKRFGLRIDIAGLDLDDLRTLERLAGLIARRGSEPAGQTVDSELALNAQQG